MGPHGPPFRVSATAPPRPSPRRASVDRGRAPSRPRARGSLGCEVVQLFTRSARQWALRPLAEDEVRAFAAARAASGIRALLAHDSYLPNPAAPVESLRARSVR